MSSVLILLCISTALVIIRNVKMTIISVIIIIRNVKISNIFFTQVVAHSAILLFYFIYLFLLNLISVQKNLSP